MILNRLFQLGTVTLFIITIGCTSNVTESEGANNATSLAATIEVEVHPTPPFIFSMWPEPGSIETLANYKTLRWLDFTQPGICIEYDTAELMEAGDFYSSIYELLPRFGLEVDGEVDVEVDYVFLRDIESYVVTDSITGEPLFNVPDGAPHTFCFAIDLEAGIHTATFTARKTSGVELRYAWSFYLLDEEQAEIRATSTVEVVIPSTPYPLFIEFTSPAPGSIQTISAYMDNKSFGMVTPGTCVSFLPYPYLLEQGDDLSTDDVLDRLSLEIDDVTIRDVTAEWIRPGEINGVSRAPNDPGTGLPLMSLPEGIYVVCFGTELDVGLHTATFVARKTSGDELRYTWSFLLE